jgi:hypothetical protein
MGRNRNDVFVLGEESLPTEVEPSVGEPPAEEPPRPSIGSEGGSSFTAAWSPSRRLAALGLAAGAAAIVCVLALGGGAEKRPPVARTPAVSPSPREATVSTPSPPAHAVPRRPVDSKPRPVSRKPRHHPRSEPEREPTIVSAPSDSTVDIPAPALVPAPAPPAPSEPPPSPPHFGGDGGGSPSARPEFSFER